MAILKNLSKTTVYYFSGNYWNKLGYFLFQHLDTLLNSDTKACHRDAALEDGDLYDVPAKILKLNFCLGEPLPWKKTSGTN